MTCTAFDGKQTMQVEKQAENDFLIRKLENFRKETMKIAELEAFVSSLGEGLVDVENKKLDLSEESKGKIFELEQKLLSVETLREEDAAFNLALQIKEKNELINCINKEFNKIIRYESKLIELNEKIVYLNKESDLKSSTIEKCKEKLLESINNQKENQKVIELLIKKSQDFEKSNLRISELESFILSLDENLADIENKLKNLNAKSELSKIQIKLKRVQEENEQLRKEIFQTKQKSSQINPQKKCTSHQQLQSKKINKIKNVSPPLDVKLHEASNPWRPIHKLKENLREEEKFRRNVRAILNKITPQNFETLFVQMKNLNIDTIVKLNIVVHLIFEHSFKNTIPNFSIVYANLSRQLALIRVPTENNKHINFRRLLLTKCQREFKNDRIDEFKMKEKQKEVQVAVVDKKYEYEQEIYEKERQLGNIKFIGELFKLRMLIGPVIHECIEKLLSQGDEKSLEYVCKLLEKTGKKLDEEMNKKFKEKMEIYFQQIEKIVDQRLTSTKIRFMLQEVIDLKRNNWVPRRTESIPKTIGEIRKEANEEALKMQKTYRNTAYNKRKVANDWEKREFHSQNSLINESSCPLSTDISKGSYSAFKELEEVHVINPGPGKVIDNWRIGRSHKRKTQIIVNPTKNTLTNRFAAFSCESTYDPNIQIPPISKEGEITSERVSAELRLNGSNLTEEQMQRKIKQLIDKFLLNDDIEEAVNCITNIASPSTIHIFINAAIRQVLERSSRARHSLGLLLFILVNQNIMTLNHYKKGFACILKLADELVENIPLIWDYLGEILEPMLGDNKYPLTILKDILQPLPSKTSGILISATLHCLSKKKGTVELKKLWEQSDLRWTEILNSDSNATDLILKHKLEFTAKPKMSTTMSAEEIRTHLLSLFGKTEGNDEVLDWINVNISENTEPHFIHGLVYAVHQNAIKKTSLGYELDGMILMKRISILKHYICNNENFELQALHSVQELMDDLNQPKDLLWNIFCILYVRNVITKKSFINWEKSAVAEGKAIALNSAKTFFTWLKQTDSGDSIVEE